MKGWMFLPSNGKQDNDFCLTTLIPVHTGGSIQCNEKKRKVYRIEKMK